MSVVTLQAEASNLFEANKRQFKRQKYRYTPPWDAPSFRPPAVDETSGRKF